MDARLRTRMPPLVTRTDAKSMMHVMSRRQVASSSTTARAEIAEVSSDLMSMLMMVPRVVTMRGAAPGAISNLSIRQSSQCSALQKPTSMMMMLLLLATTMILAHCHCLHSTLASI
jgi:hypothetical protein